MSIRYQQYPNADGQPAIWVGIQTSEEHEPISGAVADALDGFNSEVVWGPVGADTEERRFDIVFGQTGPTLSQCGDQSWTSVRVGLTEPKTGLVQQWLTVSAINGGPAIVDLVRTILSPSFAPGLVGVDWEDVRALIRSGSHALLACSTGKHELALPEVAQAVTEALESFGSPTLAGALAVLTSPRECITMDHVRQVFSVLHSVYSSENNRLWAVPLLAEGQPTCALLVVIAPRGESADRLYEQAVQEVGADELCEHKSADPLYEQAIQVVLARQQGSISLLQRHLRLGYGRACALVEAMAEAGILTRDIGADGFREIQPRYRRQPTDIAVECVVSVAKLDRED